jgi:cytosine/adenosine deaminase-related metal-dependent hydrolase
LRLLLRDFDLVATFDDDGAELAHADVLVDGGVIAAVGKDLALTEQGRVAERELHCSGLVCLPGLINSHQHLYQGAFRAVPELERAPIGAWLSGLGDLVKGRYKAGAFGPETVRAVAAAVLTESLLGGVTTVADQHYFFPAGPSLPYIEATIEAASEVGVRLHACRGTLTMGPDPDVVQSVDEVLSHCERIVGAFHDARPGAMVRVALAPCGAHVDEPRLFDELAALAEGREAVRLHTHLYEEVDTVVCRERYGCTPWEFLAAHGWAQPRTWLAHAVDPASLEIEEMAAAGVGVSHLIAPDLRMGWGLAPLREYLDKGVNVGFGTTGSASNDGADLLGDLRLAVLAHRSAHPGEPDRWPSARELLALATKGSAACLGREDLGSITPGMRADLAAWDMRAVDRVGVHDPVAALLMTGLSSAASLVLVEGEVLVECGAPTRVDPDAVAASARQALAKAAASGS